MGGAGKRQHKGHGFLGRDQICFLQEEAVSEDRGGGWEWGGQDPGFGAGEQRDPQPWVAPIFPREVATQDKVLPS